MNLPPLRQELLLHEGPQHRDGSPSWTLEDPTRGQFFRLGWAEVEILGRWALGEPEAIANDGLQLAGWVANIIDAKTSRLEENLATLAERLPAPCLGRVPKLKVMTAEAVAQHLQLDLLD